MKTKTIYESSDGVRFDSAEACERYESLANRVAEAMLPLGPPPHIEHGHSIPRLKADCLAAKRGLVEIARELFKNADYAVLKHDADKIHPCSILGRIIDDCGPACLQKAWGRLMRINFDNFREYDQPYFALNPEKADA